MSITDRINGTLAGSTNWSPETWERVGLRTGDAEARLGTTSIAIRREGQVAAIAFTQDVDDGLDVQDIPWNVDQTQRSIV